MFKKSIVALFVLLVTSFILTASTGYCGERYLSNDPVISAVDQYYLAAAAKDFTTAYYLRSECWRKCTSLKAFSDKWDDNVAVKLVDRYAYWSGGNEAIVKVRVYKESYCECSQKNYKRYYSGKVFLVYEPCRWAWKIKSIALEEEINGINFGD